MVRRARPGTRSDLFFLPSEHPGVCLSKSLPVLSRDIPDEKPYLVLSRCSPEQTRRPYLKGAPFCTPIGGLFVMSPDTPIDMSEIGGAPVRQTVADTTGFVLLKQTPRRVPPRRVTGPYPVSGSASPPGLVRRPVKAQMQEQARFPDLPGNFRGGGSGRPPAGYTGLVQTLLPTFKCLKYIRLAYRKGPVARRRAGIA